MPRDRQSDAIAVGVLILVHIAWGSLLAAQPDRFCFSDCPNYMLPRLIAIARSFQGGAIPFWDVSTFSGARPFWMSVGGIYYPLFYPLYLLVDPENLTQAAILLQIFPYVLHLTWAALGGYFFARRIIHLPIQGAIVVGLVFSFSAPMLALYYLVQAQAYSYLPWITLMAVRALDTGSGRTWAVGALLVGAMCFATSPDMANRTLSLVGIQVCGYWLLTRWRTAWTWREIARLLTLVPMVLIGMGTFSFGFVGLYNGVSMALASLSLSCEQVARFTEYSSVAPASLLTVFYPSLLVSMWAPANLGAGIVVLFAASAAFGFPRLSASLRQWTGIAAGLAGFSTLVALGYHTPVFGWACSALPLLFHFPHPANYVIGVYWALAILSGVGVSVLTRRPPSRAMVALCSWSIVAAVVITVIRPEIPSFGWQNGLTSASVYVTIAVVLLLTAAAVPLRFRGTVLWAGVLAEVLVSPFYLALNLPAADPVNWMDHTKWTLANSPLSELRPILRKISEGDKVRFAGARGVIDCQAWLVNGRALLGFDPKPIFPALEHASSKFALYMPYEQWLLKLPPFVSNMNVGFLVADRGPAYDLLRPPEDLREHFVDFNAALASLPLVARTERFDVRALPTPLPYVYTQDRVFAAGVDDQFTRLMETDLRAGAYIGPAFGAVHPATVTDSLPPADLLAATHFEELQRINRVLKVDRSNPNRKVIQIDIQTAALLVVAESWYPGWYARVDGGDVPVWEVNYLQQGVWVEPGTHLVELFFRPPQLVYGVVASAVSLLTIALVALRGGRRRASPAAHNRSAAY